LRCWLLGRRISGKAKGRTEISIELKRGTVYALSIGTVINDVT